MEFSQKEQLHISTVWRYLGYKEQPPPAQLAPIEAGCAAIEQAAQPRWVAARYSLANNTIADNLLLPGEDIARHLAGCTSCLLLAVTLGPEVERKMQAAQTNGMNDVVIMDNAASVLIEQYANTAEKSLRDRLEAEGEYLTGRFSPGYGDLPIELQPQILTLLNARRAIGLSASSSNILIPRKSITAILGIADYPVTGRLAGCNHCKLREKCTYRKEGKTCANNDI